MKQYYCGVIAIAALAACGGGGGGGTAATGTGTGAGTAAGGGGAADIFANAVAIPPGGAIPTSGAAFQTAGTAVQTVMVSGNTPGAFAGPFNGQLVASSSSSPTGTPPDAIRFTVNGQTVEVDLANALAVGSGANANTLFIQIPDSQLDLDFAQFGGWAQTTGPGGLPATGDTVNFGAFGAPTPVAQLPASSATYNGRSIGLAQVGSEAGITSSNVTVAVTNGFNDVAMSSTGTAIDTLSNLGTPQAAPNLDFTASGTVAGSGFTASGGGMTANGAFYGDAGQETAGTFNGAIGGINYGGAFGAKQ